MTMGVRVSVPTTWRASSQQASQMAQEKRKLIATYVIVQCSGTRT
jgi:hypothetical protein